jgi:predicted transcriptional regulator
MTRNLPTDTHVSTERVTLSQLHTRVLSALDEGPLTRVELRQETRLPPASLAPVLTDLHRHSLVIKTREARFALTPNSVQLLDELDAQQCRRAG